MSTLPAADLHPAPLVRAVVSHRQRVAAFAALLAIVGVVIVWPTALYLWGLWTTDPLKSIGMFIPLVSLALVLRAWKTLDWELDGSWWGLAILLLTAFAVYLRERSVLVLVLSPEWSIFLPPHSLVAVAYGAGAVLLFGGPRLLRQALFPVLLLWFVNPIPHTFNVFIDLPLQRLSAHIARGFAIALGQKLSPDQLRLMFTPDFGMFIAPGCNGIRGAITMGFIALIAGYLYRFRWYAHAALVIAAVLLGYVFNLLRLCTLVLYYIVALHIRWLQPHAEMGDYIIGACLFLVATFLLVYATQKFKNPEPPATLPISAGAPPRAAVAPATWGRVAAMLVLALAGALPLAAARMHPPAPATVQSANAPVFPAHLDGYTLSRTWDETLVTGTLIFHWADYAPSDGGPHVAIGISPVLGTHDTLICHSARGEDPLWRGQLDLPASTGQPVSFNGSFFNDGATQYVEATTICNASSCGEFTGENRHFGLVYSRPEAVSPFSSPARPIPVLIKAETIDTNLPADLARAQLTSSVTRFVRALDLQALLAPYR